VDLSESARKFWVVASLTVRYLLGTRRVIAMALLSSIPFVLALSLAGARVAAFNIILFQVIMIPLFFSVVLIFVTLVNATALIREEIEDNTIPYLLTRPISRPAVALYKYIGYLAAVLLLLVPPILLAYGVTEVYQRTGLGADRDVLGGFLVATVLGSAAYGALFLFISVLVRKPLAVGLLIGFVWESIVGSLPGDVPKLSVIHYLKSILKGMIGVTPLATYNTDISPGVAVLLLIGFSVAMIVLTMLLFAQMEFRQKA
jgi:ABC-2 type transport system permease protein